MSAAERVREARVEELAEVAHDAYEDEARRVGWITNPSSNVPWARVPDANKQCTRAVVRALIAAVRAETLAEVRTALVAQDAARVIDLADALAVTWRLETP